MLDVFGGVACRVASGISDESTSIRRQVMAQIVANDRQEAESFEEVEAKILVMGRLGGSQVEAFGWRWFGYGRYRGDAGDAIGEIGAMNRSLRRAGRGPKAQLEYIAATVHGRQVGTGGELVTSSMARSLPLLPRCRTHGSYGPGGRVVVGQLSL